MTHTTPDTGLAHDDLRHRMLHLVATSPETTFRYTVRVPFAGRYSTTVRVPLTAAEHRALAELDRAGLVVPLRTSAWWWFGTWPLVATDDGRETLARWDAECGPAVGPDYPAADYPGTVRRLPDASVVVLRGASHLGDRVWMVVRPSPDTPTVLLSDEHVADGEVIGAVPGTEADLMAEVERRTRSGR